ncbi:MAG TPA: hypothetical protein VMT89_00550 [Candidatus Acidoferrales bacterium]|nr:hypothetical protein [Candidatus Acidoferrales bacterium]
MADETRQETAGVPKKGDPVLEDVTLANMCEGKLERRWQEIVLELRHQVMDRLSDWQDKDGVVEATAKFDVKFFISHDDDGIYVDLLAGGDLQKPKRKRARGALHPKRTGLKVWTNEPKQLKLGETQVN